MNAPKRSTALGLRVASLLLLGAALAASAQIPGLPSFGEKRTEPTAPAKASGTEQSSAINAESAESRSRVDRLVADFRADRDRPLPPAPEGITAAEAATERDVLTTLAHLHDRRTYTEGEIARLRKSRADAEAAERAWTGPAQPPPYSILLVDQWRDDADALRAHVATINAAISHLGGELERAQAETKRADEALRRANDARDAASGASREADSGAATSRSCRCAPLAPVPAHAARPRCQAEDLALRQAELRRLERDIAIGMRHARFDATDLAQSAAAIEDLNAAIAQDRIRLARLSDRRQRQFDNLRMLWKGRRGTPEKAAAQAKLAVAQVWSIRSGTKTRSPPDCRASSTPSRRCGSSVAS
jgi:hypothetical protein